MPSKLQTYMQMADEAQRQITGSYRGWTGFLTTAARLYKYPYAEQVMIHAQRPDATACAEYDFWNEKMGRYVRRGSKGIALIDSSGERPRLRYVFDVSDTGGREFPKSRYLWEYRAEHADAVSAMLESRYGVDGKGGLPDQLERIASQLAEEYWRDYKRDILAIVDDSFLYGYDEFNVGAAFQSAAVVSIAYSLMSRCGLEADDRFEHEDFLSIFDFNTPEAAAELGTAVSRINGEVLRQIEVTIKKTVYVVTQFNHPREVTKDAALAVKTLREAGVHLRNQTVLLRGVNDDVAVLGTLLRKLTAIGVDPYYIFQCRPVKGIRKMFQVPLTEAVQIVDRAKNVQNGIGKSVRFVMSHPRGKIEILGKAADDALLFKFHQAKCTEDAARIFCVKVKPDTIWLDADLRGDAE